MWYSPYKPGGNDMASQTDIMGLLKIYCIQFSERQQNRSSGATNSHERLMHLTLDRSTGLLPDFLKF